MIDHVSIGVRDLAAMARFYDAALAPLGYGKSYPEFWLNARPRMPPVELDTGSHVCLRAPDTAAVHAVYDAALGRGGVADGSPGLRPDYHGSYYAAFIRDPEGNRFEVVTFIAPPA